jgi:hypothetical protein
MFYESELHGQEEVAGAGVCVGDKQELLCAHDNTLTKRGLRLRGIGR